MIINYTYGFKFGGILYGWRDSDDKLCKLPHKDKISYAFKELKLREDGRYSIGRKPKSIPQLKGVTVLINYKYNEV